MSVLMVRLGLNVLNLKEITEVLLNSLTPLNQILLTIPLFLKKSYIKTL